MEEPPKDQSPEKSGAAEHYDKAEWGRLKQGQAGVSILKRGRAMGVPQEELDAFVRGYMAREKEAGNYSSLYYFRKNMKIGTDEEVQAAGEEAYRFLFDRGSFGSAMVMAEDVYGKESEEWKHAHEGSEAAARKTEEREKKKEEKKESGTWDSKIAISKDATFADLFRALDAAEEREELDESFAQELHDNFAEDIAEEVLSLMDPGQANKAAAIKVIDFFRERGYTERDISAFLLIKFGRGRKGNK